MKITLFNNQCKLTAKNGEPYQQFIKEYATARDLQRIGYPSAAGMMKYEMHYVDVPLYTMYAPLPNFLSFYFPMGLWENVPDEVKKNFIIEDMRENKFSMHLERSAYWELIRSILRPGADFDLRDDQIVSVIKLLNAKRGIHESSTGSGKTEIMSACIKLLTMTFPDIKILVVEPTDILVNSTVERMKKYGIDAVPYKSTRGVFSHNVTIAHPMGILIDLGKDKNLLSSVDGIFWDECHHIKADTWTLLNLSVRNAEYSIGLSALAIDQKHKFETSPRKLSLDESLIVAATGKLVSYIPAGYYISNGILAQPIILQLNLTDEIPIAKTENDWHKIRELVLESPERTSLFNFAASVLSKYGRRSLMLVGTKKQAFKFAKGLCETYGFTDRVGIAYSGVCYLVDAARYAELIGLKPAYLEKYESTEEALMQYILNNPVTPLSEKEFEKCMVKSEESTVELFDKGKISILLATTILDEGVDVKELDAVFLTGGGKKARRIIQRVGRALRKSKTGKFAYIIDMIEPCNKVLMRQASERIRTYKTELQLEEDRIYKKITANDFEETFCKLEEIPFEKAAPKEEPVFEGLDALKHITVTKG